MWNEAQREVLLEVCKQHIYQEIEHVVVPEPYLPYKPKKWNGILVLAESQVIRNKEEEYAKWLQGLTPEQRMTRLGRKDPKPPYPDKRDKIGVGPWDDGTIKLALQAIFKGAELGLKLENVAVSNAVPWTRKSGGKNLNPDDRMEAKAADFWRDIFYMWKPDIKVLAVLGNIAERVMTEAGIWEKHSKNWLKLRLPSRNVINRVYKMFDPADLEVRFPEVQKAKEALRMDFKPWQVFFACHAVSLGVGKFKECFGGNNPN